MGWKPKGEDLSKKREKLAGGQAGDVEYDYSDAEFEEVVRKVIREEVYQGEGSSFVTPRKATCTLRPPSADVLRGKALRFKQFY